MFDSMTKIFTNIWTFFIVTFELANSFVYYGRTFVILCIYYNFVLFISTTGS